MDTDNHYETEKMSDRAQIVNKLDSTNWYVLLTTARSEKKVAERLDAMGVECFLPLERTVRMWSDRKKKVEIPLIPSVVFVRTTLAALSNFYSVSGVYSVLKEHGQPGVVREQEIENLRILVGGEQLDRNVQPEHFASGDAVEVIAGPFRGLHATAIEELGHFRLLVEVRQLGMGFAVSVAKNCIRKL